jgi:hypothetical protein
MAFTQEQYDKLNDAIAQGVLEVKYADKTVVYRSLDEMLRLRNVIGQELGLFSNGNGGRLYASFDKGFK